MREGNTSRVMAADRPYVEFYDFYSASPENFEYTHVFIDKPTRFLSKREYIQCNKQ
jgi:hypothetical protein